MKMIRRTHYPPSRKRCINKSERRNLVEIKYYYMGNIPKEPGNLFKNRSMTADCTLRDFFLQHKISLLTGNSQAESTYNALDTKCKLCNEDLQAIDHIIASCSFLAPTEYKTRYDRVGQYLRCSIYFHYDIPQPKNCITTVQNQ